MSTAEGQRLMASEELLELPGEGRHELIRGIVHEMPPAGGEHGEISAVAAALLVDHARWHGGRAWGAETGFVVERDPDTVRTPDAAYVGPKRAADLAREAGCLPGAPDLAVEVVSPGDSYSDVQEKALLWIASGSAVVLIVDPQTRTVTRYRAAGDQATFCGQQPVDCAPAMPGFAPTVAQLIGVR